MPHSVSEIGRPVSLVLGTPALTISDIDPSWSYQDAKTSDRKRSGNNKYARGYHKDHGEVLKIKTADMSVRATISHLMCVASLVFRAEAPYVGDAGGTTASIGLQHAQHFIVSMSYAEVSIGEITGTDGAPTGYELTFTASKTPAGAEPTVTAVLGAVA